MIEFHVSGILGLEHKLPEAKEEHTSVLNIHPIYFHQHLAQETLNRPLKIQIAFDFMALWS